MTVVGYNVLAMLPGRLFKRGVVGNSVEVTAFLAAPGIVGDCVEAARKALCADHSTQESLVSTSSIALAGERPDWLTSEWDDKRMVWMLIAHTRGWRASSPSEQALRALVGLGRPASPIIKASVEAVSISI